MNPEIEKSTTHKIRFYAPATAVFKIVNCDGSLLESNFKRVDTGNEKQSNALIQFTTHNCGKVTAQQRLITLLIDCLHES